MRNKKGFTLIELLVAMAIIGTLIGLTVFGISQAFRTSRDTKRQNLVREIQTAIVTYEGLNRRLPPDNQVTFTANASTGKSTIAVGTTTFEYDMVITKYTTEASAPATYSSSEQAYVCYKSTSTGYALGVLLEQTGGWYYITTTKC